jgi:hypothetical protein
MAIDFDDVVAVVAAADESFLIGLTFETIAVVVDHVLNDAVDYVFDLSPLVLLTCQRSLNLI